MFSSYQQKLKEIENNVFNQEMEAVKRLAQGSYQDEDYNDIKRIFRKFYKDLK